MTNVERPRLESLLAWKRAMDLAVRICKDVLPVFPESEKYALTAQLRRAAQSIPTNIAEGFGRYYFQEAVRFCTIARGSLIEVYSHLAFAARMEYLSGSTFDELANELSEVHRILNGYIGFLKRTKQGGSVVSEPKSMLIYRPTTQYSSTMKRSFLSMNNKHTPGVINQPPRLPSYLLFNLLLSTLPLNHVL